MLKLAFRNIFRQRARAGFTLAAIALGVAGLVLSGGFVQDILFQLRESTIHSQLGHIQLHNRGLAPGNQLASESLIDDPALIGDVVRRVPGFVVQAQRLGFSGLLSNRRGGLPIVGEGIEPGAEAKIGSAVTMLSGRRLSGTDRYAILVGEGLANALKLRIGDSVDLSLATRAGAANALEFKVVGIFRSLSKEYDARAVQIPLPAAQEATDTPGASSIVVLLENTDQTAVAVQWLEARLPASLQAQTWQELATFYNSTEALYRRQFGVLQAIILLMVVLSVANSVNMTLHERMQEFGIMRAIGRSGMGVFADCMLETALVGMIGSLLGVCVGVAVAVGVSAVGIPMPPPPNSESGFQGAIQVVPGIIAAALGLGVAASIAAALLPARHLARISIIDALRRGL